MYAIIESGGKQHKVTAGDRLKLELLNRESGAEVEWIPMLVVDGPDFWASKDAGAFKVVGKVLAEGRRRKILVFHKKRRKHYKKIYGHRQGFTQVEILSISKA